VRTFAAEKEQAEINVDGALPAKAKLAKPQAEGGREGTAADWEEYGRAYHDPSGPPGAHRDMTVRMGSPVMPAMPLARFTFCAIPCQPPQL